MIRQLHSSVYSKSGVLVTKYSVANVSLVVNLSKVINLSEIKTECKGNGC